jgi:hypothetical protein
MEDERRERLIRCRIVDQWTTCRRYGDPAMREAALRAFRGRWEGFMEGGWEALCAAEPAAVEAARRRAAELLPQHPQAVRVAELVARVVDEEALASEGHLLAALLLMERHGHVDLRAGWASRPAPRVPRRGHAFEDLFLLLGYGLAREPDDGG